LRDDIPLIELDANINDPQFAERAADELLEMMEKAKVDGRGRPSGNVQQGEMR
jgi:hypothetical protein